MIVEIHLILLVANGIFITIHNVIWYNYMNSYTNTSIIICILVQISLIFLILVQILFCQFLESGDGYRVEIFSVNLIFNGLLNDIKHFVVA